MGHGASSCPAVAAGCEVVRVTGEQYHPEGQSAPLLCLLLTPQVSHIAIYPGTCSVTPPSPTRGPRCPPSVPHPSISHWLPSLCILPGPRASLSCSWVRGVQGPHRTNSYYTLRYSTRLKFFHLIPVKSCLCRRVTAESWLWPLQAPPGPGPPGRRLASSCRMRSAPSWQCRVLSQPHTALPHARPLPRFRQLSSPSCVSHPI